MTCRSCEQWLCRKLVGYIWDCEDPYCECTRPVIEEITPNLELGYPWIHRKRVWEGSFHNQASMVELAEQEWELVKEFTRRFWSIAKHP